MASLSEQQNSQACEGHRSADPIPVVSSAAEGLSGSIDVPGDALMALHTLLLGAVSDGTTRIHGLPQTDEIRSVVEAIKAFGVTVVESQDVWLINGMGNGALLQPEEPLDFTHSLTAACLVVGLLSSYDFPFELTGVSRDSIKPVLDMLQKNGLQIDLDVGKDGQFRLQGGPVSVPMTCRIPARIHHIKPAVLLAGLNTAGTTSVIEQQPSCDHLETMMEQFGARIEVSIDEDGTERHSVEGQIDLKAQEIALPGDPVLAGYLVVAGLIVPNSEFVINEVWLTPSCTSLFEALVGMGAKLEIVERRTSAGQPVAHLQVCSSDLTGVSVATSRAHLFFDHYPVLAAAASFARGKTVLPVLKEFGSQGLTRMVDMFDGLQAVGVACHMNDEALTINGTGRVVGGGALSERLDTSLAMAFLIMGACSDQPVEINDASNIHRGFPEFIPLMRSLGANLV